MTLGVWLAAGRMRYHCLGLQLEGEEGCGEKEGRV